ncbi:hypothetical protein CK203_060955 [Vitis vinifera]|uniref:Uncharacterized protein n=1 Tax=Vitis vinifera TaxID=29760 RepID=A0A438G9C5_VITVI|nr:hypothetical protein CK203_060955 [Vitis vinifera]
MMPQGGGRAIITLRAADRDRERRRDCQRSWEVTCHHFIPVISLCKWQNVGHGKLPRGERGRRGRKAFMTSRRLWCVISSAFCVPSFLSEALGFSAGNICVMTMTAFAVFNPTFSVYTQFHFSPRLKNVCEQGSCSSSSSGDARAEKSVDKLSVKEFHERFCIPNGVLVELIDEEVMTTKKSEDNVIFFTKEQFNARLRFPLPSLFKEFLHFTQIPPAYIHPNIVRVMMGCSILSLLFNLDLSLLEVLFVYSLKKGKNDIFSMATHLPSLQLVTELPDSMKRGAKGHVLVRGAWAGLLEHLERPFSPNRSLVLPGSDKRGRVVEWVEKVSFAQLNKLFEISITERHHETLLTTRNLLAVVREPQAYIINILPRKLPKKEGRRKEGTLRKALGKKRSAPSLPVGAPTKKNKKKLILKKGKEIKLPTPPKEFVIPPSTYAKKITIREPEAPPPLLSVSSDSGCLAGLNHSRPSLSVAGRLALLAEEATSINQPGSSHLDADAARAPCAAALPPMAPPMEENGAETTRRSCSVRDLKSGLIGRLQDRFLETIEVSCSSVQEDHLKGSEAEMVEQNPTAPVLVPDGGGSPVDDAACISASSFSYMELEEKLKRIPPGSNVAMPSTKMFEAVETLVSGFRGMTQQHDLFSDLLRTVDYTKAFVSQRKNNEEKLRLRLEQAEASLSAAREDNEALRAELAEAKSREESVDARLHKAEDEMALLRGEVRQLRTEVSIEKKQREDLQLRLSAQKEELEAEFGCRKGGT